MKGLTTAASIWITAAIGMGIGGGYYWAAGIGALVSLITLNGLTFLETFIDKKNQTREYRIMYHYNRQTLGHFEDLFRKYHLAFSRNKQSRINENIMGLWNATGAEKNHQLFINQILEDETVKEFDF